MALNSYIIFMIIKDIAQNNQQKITFYVRKHNILIKSLELLPMIKPEQDR
jgi:hypothetical protein